MQAFGDSHDVDPRVKRVKRSAYDDIPKMFSFLVPGFEGHVDEREMRVLLSIAVPECVSIELTLNTAQVCVEPFNRNVKVFFEVCPNVWWNKARASVYIMHFDDDGKSRKRFFKTQHSGIPRVYDARI